MRRRPARAIVLLLLAGCGAGSGSGSRAPDAALDATQPRPDAIADLAAAPAADAPAGSPDRGPPDRAPPLVADAGPPMPKSYPPFVPGRRLRATYLVPADGARQYVSPYDSQLRMRCAFAFATDGKIRCLPAHGEESQLLTGIFAGPGCTNPVTIGIPPQPGCVTPRFALGPPDPSVCGLEVRPLTRERMGPAYAMGRGFGPACITEQRADNGYFEAGAPIAPAEFVEAELSTDRTGARLGAVHAVTSDGARVLLSLFDTAVGAACQVEAGTRRPIPEVMWCLPSMSTTPDGYADAACTVPLGFPSPMTCPLVTGPPARLVQEWILAVGSCDPYARFYEGGDTVTPAMSYAGGWGGTCTALSNMPGPHVRAGKEVSLQRLRREAVSGPGRLQAVDFVDAQGVRVASGTEWQDQGRGGLCTFMTAADGEQRCLPRGAYTTIGYADAACSGPMLAVEAPAPCAPTTSPVLLRAEVMRCGARWHAHQRGARLPVPSPLYAINGNGVCAKYDGGFTEAYAIGAEIPPSAFVAGTLQVE